jgi:1-aminocyclopropane-1-carboxylate deaminase/D-cysteine desulfhydrase-like pyridoxal-dependent ACC family enzyme
MRDPTPVQRLAVACAAETSLWVKRDDLTAPEYGGNKVRKLEHILGDAARLGRSRLVTVGAVGSHHVLATALFGRAAGFEVHAVLVPQPKNDHVVSDIRATLAAGARVYPSASWAGVPWRVARLLGRDAYFVPPGGSNVAGALGYVGAVRELATQVRAGEMPEPDVIFVALGSGGTAAGIAVGLEIEQLKSQLVAVCVADPAWATALNVRWLVSATARRAGLVGGGPAARVRVESTFLGRGYGHPTPAGTHAIARATTEGLALEDTYTGKTFAAALDFVAHTSSQTVLFWNTLSSASLEPLLLVAPAEVDLPAGIKRLFL